MKLTKRRETNLSIGASRSLVWHASSTVCSKAASTEMLRTPYKSKVRCAAWSILVAVITPAQSTTTASSGTRSPRITRGLAISHDATGAHRNDRVDLALRNRRLKPKASGSGVGPVHRQRQRNLSATLMSAPWPCLFLHRPDRRCPIGVNRTRRLPSSPPSTTKLSCSFKRPLPPSANDRSSRCRCRMRPSESGP